MRFVGTLASLACFVAIALIAPAAQAESNFPAWMKDRACVRAAGEPFRYYPSACSPPPPGDNFWCGWNPYNYVCGGSFTTTSVPICTPKIWDPYVGGGGCVDQCSEGSQPDSTNTVCMGANPDKPREMCLAGKTTRGNPCDPSTGSKVLVEVDYLGTGQFPLQFARYYNSTLSKGGGDGSLVWRHDYERSIRAKAADPGDYADAVRASGSVISYTRSGSNWLSDADTPDKLERLTDGAGVTTGWRLTNVHDDVLETYDAAGRLVSLTNRAGLVHTLVYSDGTATPPNGQTYETNGSPLPAGRLIRVSDQFGRSIKFGWGDRMVRMTDPDNRNYLYTYNGSSYGSYATVTYPASGVRTYHYNEAAHTGGANLPNAITGITDENGDRFATYKYQADGRAVSTEHSGGAGRVTFTYNGDGTTTVTDALGASRTYSFVGVLGVKRLAGISGPVCPECGPATQSYDANGYPSSRIDWNGNKTCQKHDSRGLELARGEGLTGSCPADVSTWTPAGATVERKITTEWHATWRLPTKICEPKRITTLGYDTKGNLATRTEQATNDAQGAQGCSASPVGTARTWTHTLTYGSTNPAVATQIVVNGPRTDVTDTTTFVYQESTGNLLSVTNALGHQTTFGNHDAHGNPRQITDPNGLVTVLVWDQRQRLQSRTAGSQLTSYTYDNVGLLKRITLPDSSYLEYVYDDAHRLTEVRDNLGNKTTYTLDLAGNRTLEETRDPGGTLRAKRSREYSSLNRLFKDIGGTNPATQVTQYGYDNQGNLTSIDGPLTGTPNDLTTLTYDALNRLKDSTNPLSGITRYTYDGLDQIGSVQDPRNNTTSYTTSGLGDQTQEVSPDRGTTTRIFNAAGLVTSSTDARGKVTASTYDALNRLTQNTFQAANPITYAWDQGTAQKGRLTTITFTNGNTTYTYDLHGRVTQKRDTHSTGRVFTVNYAWDATTGRLTSLTYPGGKVLTFGYNAAGQVTSLTVGSAIIANNIAYFPFGAPSGWTWGNSQVVTRTFDLDGRLTAFPLTTTDSRQVIYDDASRITQIKHPTNSSLVQTMGYDKLDRLTSWVDASSTRGYGYDANGNRTTLTIGANNYTYTTPGTTNRLSSTSGPSPARTFTHDAAGNITADTQFTLTYNDRGRMSQAVKGSTTATYGYDGLGQRVKKTGPTSIVPTGTNYFVYNEQGHLIGEYNSSGAVIQEYVWLGTMPIAVLRGTTASPTLFYVYADQIDRPWVITNTANQIRWRWDTSPFGELAANENPSGLGAFAFNQRLPGQYRDAETGLFHNYFRDYDSQTGRYVQSDPIGLAGGLNTYLYVAANPLRYADPLGLQVLPPGFESFGPGGLPQSPSDLGTAAPVEIQQMTNALQAWGGGAGIGGGVVTTGALLPLPTLTGHQLRSVTAATLQALANYEKGAGLPIQTTLSASSRSFPISESLASSTPGSLAKTIEAAKQAAKAAYEAAKNNPKIGRPGVPRLPLVGISIGLGMCYPDTP